MLKCLIQFYRQGFEEMSKAIQFYLNLKPKKRRKKNDRKTA